MPASSSRTSARAAKFGLRIANFHEGVEVTQARTSGPKEVGEGRRARRMKRTLSSPSRPPRCLRARTRWRTTLRTALEEGGHVWLKAGLHRHGHGAGRLEPAVQVEEGQIPDATGEELESVSSAATTGGPKARTLWLSARKITGFAGTTALRRDVCIGLLLLLSYRQGHDDARRRGPHIRWLGLCGGTATWSSPSSRSSGS